MSTENTDFAETEKPKEESVTCNKNTAVVPDSKTSQEATYTVRQLTDMPVWGDTTKPFEKNILESMESPHQEAMQRHTDQSIKVNDFSKRTTEYMPHLSDNQTIQPNTVPMECGTSSANSVGVCFTEISREQEINTFPLSRPLDGGAVSTLPLNRVIILPPTDSDNKPQTGESLSREVMAEENDGDIIRVDQTAITQDVTTVETAVSPVCSISREDNSQIQVFDNPAFDRHQQQLSSADKETTVFTEVASVISHVTSISTQTCSDTKAQAECQTPLVTQTHLRTQRIQTGDATYSLDPGDSMAEIDLSEEGVNLEVEKQDSVVKEPRQIRVGLPKYGEILEQRKAAVGFLKRNVVKGMISQGTKLKGVVNEKLNIIGKLQESFTPNKVSGVVVNQGSSLADPNKLNTMPNVTVKSIFPRLSHPESRYAYQQAFHDNSSAYIDTIASRVSAIQADNVTEAATIPGLSNRSDKQLPPPGPSAQSQLNNFDITFHSYPVNSASFVPTTVAPPSRLTGEYNSCYMSSYGPSVSPSLPLTASLPAMEYFAHRYGVSQQFLPASAPVMATSPTAANRPNFSKSQGLSFGRSVDHVSSFFRLKSNKVKDGLHRKLSPLSHAASRGSPETDFIMEEGHIRMPSMDRRYDYFRRQGLPVLLPDDLLLGAVCCCCWPLGLAARLVTLTMPDSDGPVDSFIKAMSRQLTSISLVLGIASYLVFFILWLSLIAVVAN